MRKIVFILFLFFSLLGMSQNVKGTIYFLDGKSLNGTVNIRPGGVIKYWANDGAKPDKFDYETASSLKIINEEGQEVKYEYVYFDFQKKPLLLKVEIDGFLKLYSDSSSYYAPGGSGMGFHDSTTYYLKKETDKLGQWFLCYGYISKITFDNVIEKYFVDCKAIQEKHSSGEFKKKDYVKIVNFYNQNCAPH